MTLVLFLALAIGLASVGGAAYLLALWHEDRDTGTTGWPLTRVLAYLAIAGTLASNFLGFLSLLRLVEFPNFRDIQLALSPFSLVALLTLDVLFTLLALYLRAVRMTGYMTPQVRAGLATEASVQEAIALTKIAAAKSEEAIEIGNHSREALMRLTEIVGGKEDKE